MDAVASVQCEVSNPAGITNGSSYPRANSLHPGDTLSQGQILHSPGGTAELLIEDDGNMVLYRTVDRTQLWSSGTQGKFTSGIHAILLPDGNFVLQTETCDVCWESGTKNLKDPWLTLQDTGSVVILDGQDPVPKWTTGINAKENITS